MYRISGYNEALDYHDRYVSSSKRCGIEIKGMPDAKRALKDSDVYWLRERHYRSQTKFSLFGNDERDELEKLLERSGNAGVIRSNESRLAAQRKADAKAYRIRQAQWAREDYFKHIQKANEAADNGKIKKAMKEYAKAGNCYRNYYGYDWENDPQKDEMPKSKFTPDAVEHMMRIYVDTHPLVTSNKKRLETNRQIIKMLDGKWEGKINEADRKAQEIHDQRQKKIDDVMEKVGEAIGNARIAGERLFERFIK